MGKKSKKSFYKRQIRPFIKNNRVMLAALGGTVAGLTLSNILGTEKAQQILHTVEDSVSNFKDKVMKGLTGEPAGNVKEVRRKKHADISKESVTT